MQNKGIFLIFAILILVFAMQPVPSCVDIPLSELSTEEPDTTLTKFDVADIYLRLKTNGFLIINTFGDSMKGTINTNQKCLCVPKSEYTVGDIIVFFQNGVGISHEIVYKTSSGFITKGTNNDFVDDEISASQIFCSIPEVSRWKLW